MKLKYILCMAAFAGTFTACDVTDKSPIDSLTDASYWRSVQDLKLYANGLYGNLDAPSVTKDNTSDNCVTTSYSSHGYSTNRAFLPRQVVLDGLGGISVLVTSSCSVIKL